MKKIIIFCLLFISLAKSYSQDTIKSKSNFGIRYTYCYDFEIKHDYNFRIMHHIPVFSFNINNHNFYAGPQYSYLFQPKPIANEIYENNSLGFNLGYRYYSKELIKNLQIFSQFNFSIFQIRYKEYQNGPPFVNEHRKLIIENTATIGMDYKLFNSFNLFAGIGIGSYGGFFLMINYFNLSNYIGIEYKF